VEESHPRARGDTEEPIGRPPANRLKHDLEDQVGNVVSGQQPPPIFRPERASPQGYQGLKRLVNSAILAETEPGMFAQPRL
jgi:hypothetical protein